MYVPPQFQECRPEILRAAVRDIQLAALVTPVDGEIHVTHLPLSAGSTPDLILEGHVARANPHHLAAGRGAASIAIFQGPHAYVSPAWYPSKALHGEVVPTWNYITVHVHGVLEAVDDAAFLEAQVQALTRTNEEGRQDPWSVDDAPSAYIARMLGAIVGLRLKATRMEGAWKMQQHRTATDRAGLIAGLCADARGDANAVGRIMAALEQDRRSAEASRGGPEAP